ncbi:hypothetical protein [Anabaena azotica]|uniref:hypothetical protein n=1 Tax=Anabaena azotica TaxID=197653 RepID=UPI0039A57200
MNLENSSQNLSFQKYNLLLKLVNNLKIPYGYEHSARICHQALLPNRFLLTVNKKNIKQNPEETIIKICHFLDMPSDFIAATAENITKAKFVHFGFEENQTTYLYKIYLEMGMPLKASDQKNSDDDSPILLHLGLKWDALNPEKHFITRYLWHPSITVQEILQRLAEIYQGDMYLEAFDIVKNILEIAVNQVGDDCIKYLEITEDNNQRKSYDLNIYDAQLQVKDLHHVLMKICSYYSISDNLFIKFYNEIKNKLFGHIAGGIHRNGLDFFNVYYGVEGRHG